jgi:hypothetical protein
MKTKLTPLLLSAALLTAAAGRVFADETAPDPAAAAEEGYTPYAPKQYDLSRYEHMKKKSPFEFEAPKPDEVVAVDPFEGVSLAGYAGSGKKMSVYLLIGKEKKRVTVWGDASPMKKSDDSGFRIVGLNKGKSLASSEVILEKDGVQKGIKFEEDTLKNAKGGVGGGGAPGQGGVQMMPDGKGGMIPRPVIPRPGGVQGNTGGNAGFSPPAPFIPGQTPAPATNNPAMNNNGNANPLNVQPTNPQQGINNLTVPQLNVPQTSVPGTPPGGGDGRSGNGSGRRRVVLPTQP